MALDDAALRARALRTYERGRLVAALRATWFLPPVLALSLWGCGEPTLAIADGALVLVLAVALRWRGEAWARACDTGVLAGLLPFSLPLLARALGHPCSAADCSAFSTAAIAGGLLAGVAVGLRATDRGPAAVALLLAGLIGSLGCALAGVVGVAAMGAALAAAGVPMLLRAQSAR